MAIQCNKGFALTLYRSSGADHEEMTDVQLTPNLEQLVDSPEDYTLQIIENTCCRLKFDSEDAWARLYIEGIEGIEGSQYDKERDQYYRFPDGSPFVWFKWDVSTKGMIPGSYYIKVNCHSAWYYGVLKIEPRHVDSYQLDQMKKEVEGFLEKWKMLPRGIKESIEEKNFYDKREDAQTQIKCLEKWHDSLLLLLREFKNNPYEQIEKTYHYLPKEISRKSDQTAIKKSLRRNADPNKVFSYTKSVTHENPENRWLKSFNERLLQLVTKLSLEAVALSEKKTLKKIEWMCHQLRNSEWYQKTDCHFYEQLPIRSRYDSRYRMLFQCESELWQGKRAVGLKSSRAYLWLETSWIYEIWCFKQVYKMLAVDLEYEETGALQSGYVFRKGTLTLKLHYDVRLPIYRQQTNEQTCPLYSHSKTHTRPDVRLDVYKEDKYYGSIILEFKYSSYYNVWTFNRDSRCAGQLLHYGYQLTSPYLTTPYDLPFKVLRQMNPVYKVIAVMPRLEADLEVMEDRETNIALAGLRLGKDNGKWQQYMAALIEEMTSP